MATLCLRSGLSRSSQVDTWLGSILSVLTMNGTDRVYGLTYGHASPLASAGRAVSAVTLAMLGAREGLIGMVHPRTALVYARCWALKLASTLGGWPAPISWFSLA